MNTTKRTPTNLTRLKKMITLTTGKTIILNHQNITKGEVDIMTKKPNMITMTIETQKEVLVGNIQNIIIIPVRARGPETPPNIILMITKDIMKDIAATLNTNRRKTAKTTKRENRQEST